MKTENHSKVTSDWNEAFSFDDDLTTTTSVSIEARAVDDPRILIPQKTSAMSLVAVRSAPFLLSDYCSSIRSLSVSSSLSDMASSSLDLLSDSLNLEDLKAQLSTCCSTCGVCWGDDHFSFDCRECGGYAKIRPCAKCEGNCGASWTRDYTMSHAYQTAKWNGSCKHLMPLSDNTLTENVANFVNGKTCGHFFPSDLCSRLEKITTRIQS